MSNTFVPYTTLIRSPWRLGWRAMGGVPRQQTGELRDPRRARGGYPGSALENNCRHPREGGDDGSSCRYRPVCRFPPCRIIPTPQRAVPRLYRSAGWGMLVLPRQPAHATALDAAQQRSNGCDLEQVVQPGRGTVFRTRSAKWNVTCSVSCPIAAVGC